MARAPLPDGNDPKATAPPPPTLPKRWTPVFPTPFTPRPDPKTPKTPQKPKPAAPAGPPADVVSAQPALLKALTTTMVPLDEAVGSAAFNGVATALSAFNATHPDPTILPGAVLNDPIDEDAQRFAVDCQRNDSIPAQVGAAFLAADGGDPLKYVTESELDAEMKKIGASWKLSNAIRPFHLDACSPIGNGYVTGPDGLKYTIVSPSNFQPPPSTGANGTSALNDPFPADGSLWFTTATLNGFTTIGSNPDSSVKSDLIFLGSTGQDPSPIDGESPAPESAYGKHRTGAWSDDTPANDGYTTGTVTSNGTPVDDDDLNGDGQAEVGTQLAGQLLSGGLSGATLAGDVDNTDLYQYHVVLKQGPGGERRAVIQIRQVFHDGNAYSEKSGYAYYNDRGQVNIQLGKLQPLGN